ncbi:uncharacterized protein LOC143336685 isoform X3 [Chaetodon auriga]|uniref:uncharacterized protein LOC143336685 isoform X3 n=2 Tax=Chaetodon auriga TaxID=39042 RepID=UPI004032FF86
MSLLLEKIKRANPQAAKVLQKANLRTDSCIQSLTREDLHDLFPGPENFQLRKHIFEIIQEQKPVDELISKLKASIQRQPSGASLTSNGVLFDYLRVQKGMKNQMDTIQGFLNAHIGLLEELCNHQPDQQSDKDSWIQIPPVEKASGVMSLLLEKIKRANPQAAKVLEEANLRTDSCIQSLTREDLRDLFPGPENIQMRKHIFEIIQEQPVDELISKLKASIQRQPSGASLTSNGILFDYLRLLKGMKTQMDSIQGFLNPHIGLLEELCNHQPDQQSDKDSWIQIPPVEKASFSSGPSTPDTRDQVMRHGDQSRGHLQEFQGSSFNTQATLEVRYQVVVTGKTFDADVQLMHKVLKSSNQAEDQVQFDRNSVNHQVTVLFCPICSRVGSDIEAAMSDGKVQDGKPVILVLMHHTHEPRPTPSVQARGSYPGIVLEVSVFFHERAHGLLPCEENNSAASGIRRKLLEYGTPRPRQSSAKGLGVGAKSGGTGSKTGKLLGWLQ